MNSEQGRETSPVGRVAFKAMEGRLASLVGSTPASSARNYPNPLTINEFISASAFYPQLISRSCGRQADLRLRGKCLGERWTHVRLKYSPGAPDVGGSSGVAEMPRTTLLRTCQTIMSPHSSFDLIYCEQVSQPAPADQC